MSFDKEKVGFHKPVLLKNVIDLLEIKKGCKYIDATLGGGGHTFEIIKRGGIVLGVDRDLDALAYVKEKVKSQKSKVKIGEDLVLAHGNFSEVDKIASKNGFDKVHGILFDLGVSSYQIDKSGRGFSFLRDEPLDMRMGGSDNSGQLTAEQIINNWSEKELYELFSKMGEEHNSFTIANNIVRARRISPIKSSYELAKIVQESVSSNRKIHPATKVFQALRIAVNDEMSNLKIGLSKGFDILDNGGKMLVISFHSLEDRITKTYFKEKELKGKGKRINNKPITADFQETAENPRARSAKLRAIQKN